MKLTLKIFVLGSFLVFGLFYGCDNAKSKQPDNNFINVADSNTDIQKKIEHTTQIINKAVMENDYDTQLKYFTENVIVAPPLGPAVKGKKALREGFEKNKKNEVVTHSFNTTTEDFWVSGDRIYERGTWAAAQSSKRSKIPKAFYGSYLVIWRMQLDGSLLIDYDIYTLGFNPFEGDRD